MKTMGIVVGAVSGFIAGSTAELAGANMWTQWAIVIVVAGCGVVVWDAITDWDRS